jgi:hypothetical protein
MLIILTTQEGEITRITLQSQPWQIVHEILPLKKPTTKNRAGGVTQGEGPEFKLQCHKKHTTGSQINDLMLHLILLEKPEKAKPKLAEGKE